MLAALDAVNAPWAVVTSGTRALVEGWLKVLELAHPKILVVAEDVINGKPDPEGYLMGRKKLGLEGRTDIVVFEDAPSGVRAGKAAGFKVVGLITSHTIQQVKEAGADWIVKDLSSVSVKEVKDGVATIEIRNALVGS